MRSILFSLLKVDCSYSIPSHAQNIKHLVPAYRGLLPYDENERSRLQGLLLDVFGALSRDEDYIHDVRDRDVIRASFRGRNHFLT